MEAKKCMMTVMKSRVVWSMVLVTAGIWAGCATPQINRIDRNRALYESWPLDTQQMVYEGKVEPGMTPEMVEMAWGKPTQVISRGLKPGDDDDWIYRTSHDDPAYSGMGMGSGSSSPNVSMGGTVGGITVGRGGVSPMIGSSGNMGGSAPIMNVPQIVEERHVEFKDGTVHHADPPPPK